MPLRHRVQLEDNQRPLLENDEKVLDQNVEVEVFMDPSVSLGTGSLYVTSKNVIWVSGDPEKSFSVDMPTVMMHAISRDEQCFPKACLYCILDVEDDDELNEIRFVPMDETKLQDLYNAFSSSAALNPDPVGPDDGDMGNFFFNQQEVQAAMGGGERTADQALLEAMTGISAMDVQPGNGDGDGDGAGCNGHGQFDDAEEDED